MIQNHAYIIIAFAISLIFSLIGTPLVVKLCNTRGLLDQPNARKVHKQGIPRLGGSLFMPSLGVSILVTLLVMHQSNSSGFNIGFSTVMMAAGACMIYLIGLLDDIKGLKAIHKFIIQTIAALIFPFCNLMISDLHGLFGIHEIPIWVGYLVTVFFILIIVNAMNLIDGIDGLASGLACLILGAFAYLYYTNEAYLFSLISISLAGATLAFFFFNMFGKAGMLKTFMGDSGSLFLGYIIAYHAIKYIMVCDNKSIYPSEEAFLTSWSLVFIPCIDVIRVALQRKINHKGMFEADKTHIHHLIMDIGIGMHNTLIVILCLACCICFINWGLYTISVPITYIMIGDIFIYGIFIGSTCLMKE